VSENIDKNLYYTNEQGTTARFFLKQNTWRSDGENLFVFLFLVFDGHCWSVAHSGRFRSHLPKNIPH